MTNREAALWRTVPEFGEKQPGVRYALRFGAYAVILDARCRVATIRTARGYFLPGGGSQGNESPEATLRREVLEECGHLITLGRVLGCTVAYLSVGNPVQSYQIRAVFFEAYLGEKVSLGSEPDHHLVWLEAVEVIHRLNSLAQVWAVQRFLSESS